MKEVIFLPLGLIAVAVALAVVLNRRQYRPRCLHCGEQGRLVQGWKNGQTVYLCADWSKCSAFQIEEL